MVTLHTFDPWMCDAKGTRIRTTAARWKEPLQWNRTAREQHAAWEHDSLTWPNQPERPRVFCLLLVDVFEDWRGGIVDHNGELLVWDDIAQRIVPTFTGDTCRSLTLDDCRRDLFRLIDATPDMDWLLWTKRPESILKMWPCSDAPKRANVWLGCRVFHQETADEMITKLLLACADLCQQTFISLEPMPVLGNKVDADS